MASAAAVNPAQTGSGQTGSVQTNPAQTNPPQTEKGKAEVDGNSAERVVNAEPLKDDASMEALWRPLLALPCELTVDLPLPDVTIADLLELGAGSVMRAGWQVAQDVPLRINDTLIGWGEFEAVGNRLAVRITELA